MILVDANVLVKLIHAGNPHQVPGRDSIVLLHERGEQLVSCPQVLYEMYVVCSRPVAGRGLGLGSVDAAGRVEAARAQFPVVEEGGGVLALWVQLVKKYGVVGKQGHDAHLVALMLERGISTILTFNDGDFRRYSEVTARHPCDVLEIARV